MAKKTLRKRRRKSLIFSKLAQITDRDFDPYLSQFVKFGDPWTLRSYTPICHFPTNGSMMPMRYVSSMGVGCVDRAGKVTYGYAYSVSNGLAPSLMI